MEQGWKKRENRHELKHGYFRLSVRKTVLHKDISRSAG